jgi:hypothetical protein
MAGAPPTAATRQMSPDPETPVAPQPVPTRRPPPRQRPVITPAEAPKRRSALGSLGRGLGVLLLIGVLAAVIAGAVLLLTDAGQDTDLGNLIKNEVNEQVDSLRDLIEDNTQ